MDCTHVTLSMLAGAETQRKAGYYLIKGLDGFINGVRGITQASKALSKADNMDNKVRDAAGVSVEQMEQKFGWQTQRIAHWLFSHDPHIFTCLLLLHIGHPTHP